MRIGRPKALEAHLERVTWDTDRLPARLNPFLATEIPVARARPIAIDPRVAPERRGRKQGTVYARVGSQRLVVSGAEDGADVKALAAAFARELRQRR